MKNRNFPYITVGKILDELWEDASQILPQAELWRINNKGERVKRYPVNRVTFYRLEKRLDLARGTRKETESDSHRWRVYTREEADSIKQVIKKKYLLQ